MSARDATPGPDAGTRAPDRAGERGAAAPAALAVLFLLAALAGAASFALGSPAARLRGAAAEAAARGVALECLAAALAAIEEAGADGVDARGELDGAPVPEGAALSIEDASSRLNPNLVRADLLRGGAASAWLLPEATAEDLARRREARGPSTDLARAFEGIIEPGAIGRFLTPYSYGSVNADDEDCLARLVLEATGDRGLAGSVRSGIRRLREAGGTIRRQDLAALFGPERAALAALVGVEPQVNVNLAAVEVLEAILGLEAFGFGDPSAVAARIAAAAEGGPIDRDGLAALLDVPGDHPVLAWLGTRTWFWRVAARVGGRTFRALVRVEPGAGAGRPRAVVCEFGSGEEGDGED